MNFKIERRENIGAGYLALAFVMAIAGALLIAGILIRIGGAPVGVGLMAMFNGAFGSWKAFSASLVKATPLIFTGLATVVAFRAKIWNIGQEGQLYAGAMAAYAIYRLFENMPLAVLIMAVLIGAILGGALWGLVAAIIKAKFGVEVLITSIMLNYIIMYILSWLLSGPWKDPATYYRQSPLIAEAAHFPAIIEGSRVHIGLIIALVVAIILYILLEKSPLGYEIRAVGNNPVALSFQGTSISRILIIVMVISGALSGLAGAGELFGIHHRLRADISLGYGYTGITIAMLANLMPILVIPAAIFFGGLINGSSNLQIVTGVPSAITDVIQAVVLLFLLAASAVMNYRLRRITDA